MAAGASSLISLDQAEPALMVKYWGVTGSFSDPWRPETTRDWLTRVLLTLRERGVLTTLAGESTSPGQLEELLRANLSPTLLAGPRRQTTCLEVRTPTALFLVDAGSGLQDHTIQTPVSTWPARPAECHLLFTHGHWDHLLGLPFYAGFFTAACQFTVWGTERVLALLRMMFERDSALGETLIPTKFEHLQALGELRTIAEDKTYAIAGVQVSTLGLNHPAGALAYRFEYAGRAIVIATDHEQDAAPEPAALIDFAQGAELLYLDAQYRLDEYEGHIGIAGEPPQTRRGWGHSTIETAVATGIAAGVKRLQLGHHEPRRSDSELEQLEKFAQVYGADLLKAQNRSPDECQISLARAGDSWLL
jgi:ribonuclease BN (tRNA processing enzyme)